MRVRDNRAHDAVVERLQALAAAAAVLAGALACSVPVLGATPTLAVGAEAPDFVLKDTDGRNRRLSEYRGDVVIVAFTAAWCGACRSALAELNGIASRTADAGPAVLGVSLDGGTQGATSMARSLELDYPLLIDTHQDVGRLYDVGSLPFTLLLDAQGVVRAVWADSAAPASELRRQIAEVRP